MQNIIHLVAVLFSILSIINATSTHSNRSFQQFRNDYLRFYLFHKKECKLRTMWITTHNVVREKTGKIYQSIISKYYDSQIFYYSLPEDDRELIEHIINMHF